jgi:hypothetical protein
MEDRNHSANPAETGKMDRRGAVLTGVAAFAGLATIHKATAQDNSDAGKDPARTIPKMNLEPGVKNFSKELADVPPFENFVDKAAPEPVPAFQRPETADLAWKEIAEAIGTSLGITEGNRLDAPLSHTFSALGRSIRNIGALKEDPNFYFLHVEPLVDQAADLLDRSIQERASYDAISEKALKLALELNEYKELDKIHQREESAGLYDVPHAESSARANAEQRNQGGMRMNKYLIKNMLDRYFSFEKFNSVANEYRKSAWLGGLVPYSWEGQRFGGYASHTYGSVTKEANDHMADAGWETALHSMGQQEIQARIQEETYESAELSSGELLHGLEAKAKWDNVNRSFQRQRTLVARKFQDLKAKAATSPDGILNYAKRLGGIRSRFEQDFKSAYSRLIAAEKGLRIVYGYNKPLPRDSSQIDFYDDVLFWTRDAIDWLVRFSRLEQTIVLPLEVRRLTGPDRWDEGCKNGVWTFEVSESAFPNMHHMRMRGVSVTVSKSGRGTAHDLYQVILKAPKASRFTHLHCDQVPVDQASLPPLVFGRVSEREDRREPDILGLSSWHNVSPVGLWTVEIPVELLQRHRKSERKESGPPGKRFPISTAGSSPGITGISVELHMSYRHSVTR